LGGDVWEVRAEHVDGLVERFEEVAGQKDDTVLQAVASHVATRPLERLGGDIDAPDLGVGSVRSDREPDDPRPSADVRDTHETLRPRVVAYGSQRRLDEFLGLGA